GLEDGVRREPQRLPADPRRLEVDERYQRALLYVLRRLERGGERPVDREQADERPQQQRAVDRRARDDAHHPRLVVGAAALGSGGGGDGGGAGGHGARSG